MTLRELQEKRDKLVHDARDALSAITANTDTARAAELEARHDTIMAEFDQVDRNIEREERTASAERDAEARRERRRPNPGGTEGTGVDDPNQQVNYRSAFHRYVQVAGDLSQMSDEDRSALRGGVAREARAQTVGTSTGGGYTVPTELSNQIIQSMKAWGPMYDEDICTTMNTTSGGPIDIPTIDDTNVPVGQHTEAGAVTDDGGSDATFGKKTLNAFAFDTEWVKFSWELAQDSIFNFETLLGDLLGQRLGRRANLELTTGIGAGAPQGIVAGSSLGVTSVATAAITYDEMIDLEHSVDPAYRQSPKARFMFHDTTLAAIRKLKDSENRYIWTGGDVQNGAPATILGRRYSVNQAMDPIAAGKKAVLFGDFGKFFVRKVGGTVLFVARERFAPDIGLLGLIRLDGKLGDAAAVKHLITKAA